MSETLGPSAAFGANIVTAAEDRGDGHEAAEQRSLVERLRAKHPDHGVMMLRPSSPRNPEGPKAADEIERLTALVSRLEETIRTDREHRFFVVTACASLVGPQMSRYGFRSRLIPAGSSDEAVGIAVRLMREDEPDWSFSEPAAIEISPETKASARARLSARQEWGGE